GSVDFEVRLHEGSTTFQVIYGTVTQSGSSATVGVQKGTGSLFTQYECNTGGLSAGQMLTFTLASCGTPAATPTQSQATATPTCQAGGTPGPWVIASPVPYAARGISAVSDGTYVYMAGGYDGSTVHNDNLRYNPATNTYTTL